VDHIFRYAVVNGNQVDSSELVDKLTDIMFFLTLHARILDIIDDAPRTVG